MLCLRTSSQCSRKVQSCQAQSTRLGCADPEYKTVAFPPVLPVSPQLPDVGSESSHQERSLKMRLWVVHTPFPLTHLQRAVKLILLSNKWRLEIALPESEKGAALPRACGGVVCGAGLSQQGWMLQASVCSGAVPQGWVLGPAVFDILASSTGGGGHPEQVCQQHQAVRCSHTLDTRDAIQRYLDRPQRWPCANLMRFKKSQVQGAAPGLGQAQAQGQAAGTCHLCLEGSYF